MRKLKNRNLGTHVFYLVLIGFALCGFIIYSYDKEERVLHEQLQTCRQDLGTQVSLFQAIEPQLGQKVIHIYPFEMSDNEELRFDEESGVVK